MSQKKQKRAGKSGKNNGAKKNALWDRKREGERPLVVALVACLCVLGILAGYFLQNSSLQTMGRTQASAQTTPDPNDKTPRVVITCFGLPNSDFTISVGQSVDLNCTMYNIDPSTNTETWTIDDTAIATVNENGVVTGVKEGTTKVICAVGDVKCETIVRVTDKKI